MCDKCGRADGDGILYAFGALLVTGVAVTVGVPVAAGVIVGSAIGSQVGGFAIVGGTIAVSALAVHITASPAVKSNDDDDDAASDAQEDNDFVLV